MPENLRRLLDLYPAAIQPMAGSVESLGNAGGLSGASLFRFPSGQGLLAARAWPIDGPGLPSIARIHRWLERASPLGFVPVPIATLDGRTAVNVDGVTWEVAPWLSGEPERGEPPDLRRVIAAFTALAAFHARLAVPNLRGPSPGIEARRIELEEWRTSGFSNLERLVSPDLDEISAATKRWLVLAKALAPSLAARLSKGGSEVPLQPCLRDARPEHFLFQGETLSGLVDFGAMDVDSVAGDLARLISLWLPRASPAGVEALRAYESIRPLEVSERRLIELFEDSSRLLGPGRWARWLLVDRKPFRDATEAQGRLIQGVERFESAV